LFSAAGVVASSREASFIFREDSWRDSGEVANAWKAFHDEHAPLEQQRGSIAEEGSLRLAVGASVGTAGGSLRLAASGRKASRTEREGIKQSRKDGTKEGMQEGIRE
jgi:hypothetical protein